MPHGSRNGHTLCPAQFEHTLYILAKEGGFNGKISRLVFGDESADRIKNELKFFIIVFYLSGFQYTQFKQRSFIAGDADKAIAHHDGAGVSVVQ